MKIMNGIIWSSIVSGVFAVGCVDSPATTEEPVAQSVQEPVGQIEQGLGATTQAQERLVTYYSEPALINIVGSCFGPYSCFGPKGTTCTGIKTPYYTVEWFDCF